MVQMTIQMLQVVIIRLSEIGLYDDQQSLVGYARLSKPIPKSQKIPMKFLLRLDY